MNFFYRTLLQFCRWVYKGVMRRVTGKCELLRLTLNAKDRVVLTNNIERSITLSRFPLLNTVFDNPPSNLDRYIFSVFTLKGIKPEQKMSFKFMFGACLVRLLGLKEVKKTVMAYEATKFNPNNHIHMGMINRIEIVLSNEPYSIFEPRRSIQISKFFWMMLQSNSILVVFCLEYYLNNFKSMAKFAHSRATSHNAGYNFYQTAAEISHALAEALCSNKLNSYFYAYDRPTVKDFYRLFVQCFTRFHAFWAESGFTSSDERNARSMFRRELSQKIALL